MARLLFSVVLLMSYAWAQATAPLPPSATNPAASQSARSNAMTPNPTSPPDVNSASSLPGVLPPPSGKTTLVGGTIENVDHVRDRLILDVFGGGRTAVLFDERTRVLRPGAAGSLDDLKNGERVYVDTALDGPDVFARTIRLAQRPAGQSKGQIVAFEPARGELTLRDALSPEPVTMRVSATTAIRRGDHSAASSDLRPGTLVTLTFTPGSGGMANVTQVSILASPGAGFVFSGRIDYLDLHRGLLVLVDPRDNQSYEVNVDSTALRLTRDLRQGMDVTVQASFDGRHYEARTIAVNPTSTR